VCENLAITLSTEVGEIRALSQPITLPGVSMKQSTSLPVSESFPYVAYIGIDWADRKHDICLYDPITQQSEFSTIGSQPEAIDAWVEGLRKRFPQGTIAICTEQKRGPLIYALCKYEFLVIHPVNPQTVAKYHHAFAPSRAKADPRMLTF